MKRAALQSKTPLVRKTPLARSASPQRDCAPKAPRQKKCAIKSCRQPYTPDPRQPFKVWCSDECGTSLALAKLAKAKEAQARQVRRETKAAKDKLKTRRDYMKEAQSAFNAFIRERDCDLPCICCGRFPRADHITGGTWDAGHYRSVGSAPHLRFHEDNVHRQLKQCNQFGAGRAVDYRLGLIARIGLARVEALESDQEPRKHTPEELQAITKEYKQKLKELRRRNE